MVKRGKLAVITGIGGSGKSTCIELIRRRLDKELYVFTREPGGTPFGEAVRNVALRSTWDPKLIPFEELMLMMVPRSYLMRTLVVPALEDKHVIIDRFVETTFAHQVFAVRADERLRQLFHDLSEWVCCGIVPDVYIVLNLPPEVAHARRQKDRSQEDVFDDRDIEFFRQVQIGIMEFTEFRGRRVVNADRCPEEVACDVEAIIREVMGDPPDAYQ